jgi:hypothetical protein
MKCAACSREASARYCAQHAKALVQLKEHYDAWVLAYGSIPWEKYLEKLAGMKETGTFVKEVIKAELKK